MKTRRLTNRIAKMAMRGGVIKHFPETDDDWGGVYDGELNDKGERHGKGRMVFSNGCEYLGDWKNDKMDGNGKYTYNQPNGITTYEGEFENDVFRGVGVYKSPEVIYRGQFDNDRRNGIGYLTTIGKMGQGTIYGEFVKDKLVKGVGKRCLGIIMEIGEFKDDKLEKGIKHTMDGMILEGDFNKGVITNGKKTWPGEEQVYIGTYNKRGEMSGYGMIMFANKIYEGQFVDDTLTGMGKLTLPDRTTITGYFDHGQPSHDAVKMNAAQQLSAAQNLAQNLAQNSIIRELGPAGRVFSRTSKRRPSGK